MAGRKATLSEKAGSPASAIMVADVVAYHHLMETDEDATVAAMRTLRRGVLDPLFTAHDGTIVKLIDDEIIAVFGSAADAARCAAAIQAGLADHQKAVEADRRIVLRAGIDVGEIRAEGDGVAGAGVELATRLKDICEPGSVLISDATENRLLGKSQVVVIDDAGTKQLEDGEEPMHAYAARMAKTLGDQSSGRGIQPVIIVALAALLVVGGYLLYQARIPAEGDGVAARDAAAQETPSVASDEGDNTDPNLWGELDGIAAGGKLSGWAVDVRDPSDQLAVYLYISGQDPSGRLRSFSGCISTNGGERNQLCGDFTFLGEVVADQPYNIPTAVPERVQRGSHGFYFPVPQQFQDGAEHYFYAYIIPRGHEDEADALRRGENPDDRNIIYLYRSPRSATLSG